MIQVSSVDSPAVIKATKIKDIAEFYIEQEIELRSVHSAIYSQVIKTITNYTRTVSLNKETEIETFLRGLGFGVWGFGVWAT